MVVVAAQVAVHEELRYDRPVVVWESESAQDILNTSPKVDDGHKT